MHASTTSKVPPALINSPKNGYHTQISSRIHLKNKITDETCETNTIERIDKIIEATHETHRADADGCLIYAQLSFNAASPR